VLAAVTRSPGEMVVENVDGPRRARPGHVIVRPEAVGICGSDFHLFSGDVAALSGASHFYPRVQGHEVAAVVADPGDSDHEEGDRVAIWPLLPCGRCGPRAGEHVLVIGAGPIGLAVLAAARHGKARVMSVDPVKTRRALAANLGAEVVTGAEEPEDLVARARDWTAGEGPPLVVETSGAASVLKTATEIVAPAGRVVVVGMSSGAEPIRPGIFPEKEIDVLGSSTATAADFRYAISLVTSVRENISKLFSHHFPLARAAEAFEFAMSRPPDAVKIVVNVN
jgi:threonine dehydrogenase-like Zn-dependent dehydrogenase